MLTTSRCTVCKRGTPARRLFPSRGPPTMAKTGGPIAVMNAKTSKDITGGSISGCAIRNRKVDPMSESFIDNYKAKHRHPLNKLAHSIGIPLIVISLPLFFISWRWALGLFIVGWAFQFLGHVIEGNQPAFFKNPLYLLVGPLWLLRRVARAIGLVRSSR